MNQEYFTVELASEINLGIPLVNMGTVAQFDIQSVCTVPGIANFWYGVVNFKGSLLWVLDSDQFFNLSIQRNQRSQKLTTVILKSEASVSPRKVAIVTQHLKGLLSITPSCLEPTVDNAYPQLRECCPTVVQTESQTTYIIDSAILMQQLHQQSILVST